MKEGRKPEYPEKTPGDELQKSVEYDIAVLLSEPCLWPRGKPSTSRAVDLGSTPSLSVGLFLGQVIPAI